MAAIDSASSWHGGGNCRNQCATRIADLARHQPLDMEGPALAHNNTTKLPSVESVTTPVVDDKLGPDDNLDRKFLNNNNNSPSMKCLQHINPPPADPPPPPALLFDYVVEQSVQQQHNLLDSEIKRLENVSFNCNRDEQSANSQVEVQVAPTNSPSIKIRPVVRTEEDGGQLEEEQVGPPKTDLVDNDDLLEATNRSESQLDINTATATTAACFRGPGGRVLPKLQTLDQTRPIYPNVPYSPYNSPYGSPRSGRRRTPLRESRRVSIEQTGSFLQLNQYKLLDQIGQHHRGMEAETAVTNVPPGSPTLPGTNRSTWKGQH